MLEKLSANFHKGRIDAVCNRCSDGLILLRGEVDWFRKMSMRKFDPAYGDTNFKQEKNLYYLTGVEVPNSFLLIDPLTKEVHLYTDWANEDELNVVKESGVVKDIHPANEFLLDVHERSKSYDAIYTLYSSYVGEGYLGKVSNVATGIFPPGMCEPVGEDMQFAGELKRLFPGLRIKNLDDVVTDMRRIKQAEEIELIRYASTITAEAITEVMRCVAPGKYDHELTAVVEYIFYKNGAHRNAFSPNLMSGPNSVTPIQLLWSSYNHRDRMLQEDDYLIINIGAEYHYYQSLLARSVPVSGKYTDKDREMYEMYLTVYMHTLEKIRAGITPNQLKEACIKSMEAEKNKLNVPYLKSAADDFIQINSRRPALGHYVDMNVVGEGALDDQPMEDDMVFTLEPLLFDFKQPKGVMMANIVVVKSTGYEMLSDTLPFKSSELEKIMAENGIGEHLN